MTKQRKRLAKITRWLRRSFPGDHPIRVIVAKMPKDVRDCDGVYYPPVDSKLAVIRVNPDQGKSAKVYTLMHEWAHYRVDPGADRADRGHGGHTNEFYLEYGRIERAFFEALEGELKIKGKSR